MLTALWILTPLNPTLRIKHSTHFLPSHFNDIEMSSTNTNNAWGVFEGPSK